MMGFPVDWTEAPMTPEEIEAKREMTRRTRGASEPSETP
jgi:L-alanine-DL-glutamate epimerase-like enolase superfamily enzyme